MKKIKTHVWFMSFEQSVECRNWCYCYLFNCSGVLQFGAHSRYYKGASTQKRLYYFQICFSCRLKKSKQTFITKFVIRHCSNDVNQILVTQYKQRAYLIISGILMDFFVGLIVGQFSNGLHLQSLQHA